MLCYLNRFAGHWQCDVPPDPPVLRQKRELGSQLRRQADAHHQWPEWSRAAVPSLAAHGRSIFNYGRTIALSNPSDPSIGRAEAPRRAMMAMLDPQSSPEFAHPLAWATFVLAGEGGAGR